MLEDDTDFILEYYNHNPEKMARAIKEYQRIVENMGDTLKRAEREKFELVLQLRNAKRGERIPGDTRVMAGAV